jgi:hypothetical protein
MAAKIALVTDGNEESDLKSAVIRPARDTPFRWVRALSIEGGIRFGGFSKPTSDGAHGSYQGDELRPNSRNNDHWDNSGASIFEAA